MPAWEDFRYLQMKHPDKGRDEIMRALIQAEGNEPTAEAMNEYASRLAANQRPSAMDNLGAFVQRLPATIVENTVKTGGIPYSLGAGVAGLFGADELASDLGEVALAANEVGDALGEKLTPDSAWERPQGLVGSAAVGLGEIVADPFLMAGALKTGKLMKGAEAGANLFGRVGAKKSIKGFDQQIGPWMAGKFGKNLQRAAKETGVKSLDELRDFTFKTVKGAATKEKNLDKVVRIAKWQRAGAVVGRNMAEDIAFGVGFGAKSDHAIEALDMMIKAVESVDTGMANSAYNTFVKTLGSEMAINAAAGLVIVPAFKGMLWGTKKVFGSGVRGIRGITYKATKGKPLDAEVDLGQAAIKQAEQKAEQMAETGAPEVEVALTKVEPHFNVVENIVKIVDDLDLEGVVRESEGLHPRAVNIIEQVKTQLDESSQALRELSVRFGSDADDKMAAVLGQYDELLARVDAHVDILGRLSETKTYRDALEAIGKYKGLSASDKAAVDLLSEISLLDGVFEELPVIAYRKVIGSAQFDLMRRFGALETPEEIGDLVTRKLTKLLDGITDETVRKQIIIDAILDPKIPTGGYEALEKALRESALELGEDALIRDEKAVIKALRARLMQLDEADLMDEAVYISPLHADVESSPIFLRMLETDYDPMLLGGVGNPYAVGYDRDIALDMVKVAIKKAKNPEQKAMFQMVKIALEEADSKTLPFVQELRPTRFDPPLGQYFEDSAVIETSWSRDGIGTTIHELAHFMSQYAKPEAKEALRNWHKAIGEEAWGRMRALGLGHPNQNTDELFARMIEIIGVQDMLPKLSKLDLPEEILQAAQEHSARFLKAYDDPFLQPLINSISPIYRAIYKNSQALRLQKDPAVKDALETTLKKVTKMADSIKTTNDEVVFNKAVDGIANVLDTGRDPTVLAEALKKLFKADMPILPRAAHVEEPYQIAYDLHQQILTFKERVHDSKIGDHLIEKALTKPVYDDVMKQIDNYQEKFIDFGIRMDDALKASKAERGEILTSLSRDLADFEHLKNTLKDLNRGMYEAYPSMITKRSLSIADNTASRVVNWLGKKMFGPKLSDDISRLDVILRNGHDMVRKHPFLSPLFNIWRRYISDSSEMSTAIFQGKGLTGFQLPSTTTGRIARPVADFISLDEKSPVYKAAAKGLWEGNELANTRVGPKKLREKGINMSDQGILSFGEFRKRTSDLGLNKNQLEDAYDYYAGVAYSYHWMGENLLKFMESRQILGGALLPGGKDQISNLRLEMNKMAGYVPQMRKGDYKVSVIGDEGAEYVARGTKREMLRLEADIRSTGKLPDGTPLGKSELTIKHSPKEPSEAFYGASPGNMTRVMEKALESMRASGKDIDSKFVENMRAAIADSMKEGPQMGMLKARKNIKGFRTDLKGITNDYVRMHTNFMARYEALSGSVHALQLLKGKPRAWKWGNQLITDLTSPNRDFDTAMSTARNLVLMRHLGFNMTTAMLQLTQNLTATLPRMGLDGIKRPHRVLMKAFKDTKKGIFNKMDSLLPEELGLPYWETRALAEGYANGTTWSNFIAEMGRHSETGFGGLVSKGLDKALIFLRKAEEWNRKATLLAGYRHFMGKSYTKVSKSLAKRGINLSDTQLRNLGEEAIAKMRNGRIVKTEMDLAHKEAMEKAVSILNDSHYIYEKANLPQWARGSGFVGAVGRQAYLLKSFSHNYVLMLGHFARQGTEGQKAIAKSMGALIALGGLEAFPGFHLTDWAASKYGTTPEEVLGNLIGDDPATLVMRGPLSAVTGVRVASRVNPVSGGMLDVPILGLAKDAGRTYDEAKQRDWVDALNSFPLLPSILTRIPKNLERYEHGYIAKSGKKLPNSELNLPQLIGSFAGLSYDNEAYVRYARELNRKIHIREKKLRLGAHIREKMIKGAGIDISDLERYHKLRQEAIGLGQPWGYKSIMDMAKDLEIEIGD